MGRGVHSGSTVWGEAGSSLQVRERRGTNPSSHGSVWFMLLRTMMKRFFSLLGCGQEASMQQEGQQSLFSTIGWQKHRRIENV